MNKDIIALIDESIALELNVSRLYALFRDIFPDDKEFWWKLVLEEQGHAALIRSGKEYFKPIDKFPMKLLSTSLLSLQMTNGEIHALIEKFTNHTLTREEAFNAAFDIEISAGELHFQQFMVKDSSEIIDNIFQRLNKDDKDHAERILVYMEKNGITIRSKSLLF